MRGCEATDYPREASTCESKKVGGLKPPVPPPLQLIATHNQTAWAHYICENVCTKQYRVM